MGLISEEDTAGTPRIPTSPITCWTRCPQDANPSSWNITTTPSWGVPALSHPKTTPKPLRFHHHHRITLASGSSLGTGRFIPDQQPTFDGDQMCRETSGGGDDGDSRVRCSSDSGDRSEEPLSPRGSDRRR